METTRQHYYKFFHLCFSHKFATNNVGFGKFNKMFPLKDEEKKCFRRTNNGDNKQGTGQEKVGDKCSGTDSPEHATSGGSSQDVSTEPVTDVPPVQWHLWHKSSYAFVQITSTWDDAVNACSSMGNGIHLVFIESELENKEVSRLANIASEGKHWWIGLNDKETEGVWKWYNITSTYTKWMKGEPSNGLNREHCGHLKKWQGDNALWNDLWCERKIYFICEKDVES
ncbi:C-type lectin [Holothuria leucospilota]|uniref:C-type lectin n=1 Tax=Holothuria leucospilota TaxID=206669 RepID=A0A9Q1H8P7_HOLLE|nr:C-type lectin [Holothuria leucospilota]